MRHRAGCKSLEWLASLKQHDGVLQHAPQKLFEDYNRLAIFVPVPIFDISTALTVFTRGFMPLPGFIGAFNQAPTRPTGRKRKLLVAQANSLVYRLLHQSRWPKGLKLIQVRCKGPHPPAVAATRCMPTHHTQRLPPAQARRSNDCCDASVMSVCRVHSGEVAFDQLACMLHGPP